MAEDHNHTEETIMEGTFRITKFRATGAALAFIALLGGAIGYPAINLLTPHGRSDPFTGDQGIALKAHSDKEDAELKGYIDQENVKMIQRLERIEQWQDRIEWELDHHDHD